MPSLVSHHAIHSLSVVNSFVMRHAPELQRNTVKVVALVPNVIEEPFVAALSLRVSIWKKEEYPQRMLRDILVYLLQRCP